MRAPLPPTAARLMMFTPPIVYCGWLWWLSSSPSALPPGSNDFLVHVGAFLVLGVLTSRALWFTSQRSAFHVGVGSWLWAAGYGVVDELHQGFVPSRTCSALDMVADASGALLGVVGMLTLYVLSQRLDPRRS